MSPSTNPSLTSLIVSNGLTSEIPSKTFQSSRPMSRQLFVKNAKKIVSELTDESATFIHPD